MQNPETFPLEVLGLRPLAWVNGRYHWTLAAVPVRVRKAPRKVAA